MSDYAQLKKLHEEKSALFRAADAKSKEISDLSREIARTEYHLVGGKTILRVRDEEYLLESIEGQITQGYKPWVSGRPRKANGEWSRAVRNLYGDWEVVS